MRRRIARLGLVGILVLSTGCAIKPQQVDNEFWQQTSEPVAVAMTTLPEKGAMYQEGQQGLLDILVTAAATNSLNTYLETLSPAIYEIVSDEFEQELRARGFNVKRYQEPIDLDTMGDRTASTGEYKHDLSSVFEETGAERIILLTLTGFGVSRTYWGFIPVSAPSGVAMVHGVMVEKQNHRISWHTGNSILESTIKEPVVGDWDQPPRYSNLTAAVKRALARSKKVLLDKFFVQ